MLARARRGQWAREAHEQNDEKSRGWFIPCNKSPRLPEITIKTEHDGDMGIVTVRMQGECITSFHFSIPWPKDRSKTHTIRARIGYQSSVAWHWQGGLHRFSTIRRTFDRRCVPYPVQEKVGIQNGTLSTELGAILDGNYCISKSRHILQPGFQRSHCSWEDFPERQESLWPEIAKMLLKGILEYIARHCRLPLRIIAVGAVPKATAPFWRLIMDCRPINTFVDPWRVRYVSLQSLSLILRRNCVFWVIDLKAAYFDVSLGGC